MNNRQLSGVVPDLLRRLKELSAKDDSTQHRRELRALIAAIAESAQMLAAPALLEFASHADDEVAAAAVCAIRASLADTAPQDLVFLDEFMRADAALACRSPDVHLLCARHGCSAKVLGLASFHRDGFVREAATRALAALTSACEIPFLLIRANDWVPQVRDAATQALMARAGLDHASHLVRSMPLITRLRTLGRADHTVLVNALNNAVANGAGGDALRAGIRSADRSTRRACIKLAIAQQKISLCLNALASADSTVRADSARFLLASLVESEACALAGELSGDSFAVVRCAAFRVRIERCAQQSSAGPGDGLPDGLREGLLDEHSSVRRLALSYARSATALDVAAFYRQHIPVGPDRRTAASIAGLGECGDAGDVPLLRSYLGHRSLRIRCNALHAIALLDSAGNAHRFCAAVTSTRGCVSRKAHEILLRLPTLADCAMLEDAMLAGKDVHVRSNALKVLVGTGRWSGLRATLLALQHDDDVLHDLALLSIRRWLRKHGRHRPQVASGEMQGIASLLEALRPKLPDGQYASLRAMLPSA